MRPLVPLSVVCSVLISLTTHASAATPPAPAAIDSRLTVELVAMEPDVRTPTSIQVDEKGRVWVLENNTHFRPKVYDAPPTDRVLVMEDFGPDGRARKITSWAEGFRDGMSLFLLPNGGGVVVSTRAETLRFRDTDNDGKADQRTTLLKMETKDEYPHNGLSGLAMGPDGKLYLGLGENHGEPWILTGSNGVEIRGSDEGAIFRFNPDGTGLEWFAMGVWNPFGLAFRKDGQLFALDNDPSGGSLCRLLHVVRGGDYGYRYRYGRTIEHPFLAWFGQIPGTLPPVTLVGEAPCGIMAYRATSKGGFPAEYDGELLGTTWSDHGIQRYPLTANGASYTSKPEFVIRGDHYFRPSGVAQAPDGSLFVSDWVDGAYEVHGKGRVWRVRAKEPTTTTTTTTAAAPAQTNSDQQKLADLLNGKAAASAVATFSSEDPFLFHAAVLSAAEKRDVPQLMGLAKSGNSRERLGALLALRKARAAEADRVMPAWLSDQDPAIRKAALQWISEDSRKDLLPLLAHSLDGQPTRSTFQAYLAAIQMLTSGKPDPKATTAQTAEVAMDPNRAPELRALALRLLPTSFEGITPGMLETLAGSSIAAVRLEAVRILEARSDVASQSVLRKLATGPDATLAAEAIAGLVYSKDEPATAEILKKAAAQPGPLQRIAERSLGTAAPATERLDAQKLAEQPGDPTAGRRLFYHPNGPRCFTCHSIEGRGMVIGPDLTQLGRFTSAQILEAIQEPSKEIAPAYAQWHIKMKDGTEAMGIDLFEDNKSTAVLIDPTGTKTKYKIDDMVTREVMPISMMPPGLDGMLGAQEVRDLVAYLRESRE